MEIKYKDIAQSLEDKITLYKHLGITVRQLDAQAVHFDVELAKNLNHKGTAFGGSLYATAVLGAYALVWVSLRDAGIQSENIVIAKGEIQYLRPVESDFQVQCSFDTSTEAIEFVSKLKQNKSARLVLQSKILDPEGSLRAVLTGEFVAKI